MCPVKPIRFVSPRQQRIHDRVAHLGEGAQAFYRDLLRVADDPSLESASHLAGHLVREIESALQDVLTPLTTASATSATEEPGEGGEAEEKSSHRTKVLGFLAALGVKHGDPAEKAWLALIKSRLHRSAHRPGLDGPRSPDLVGDQLSLLDDCLDAVLDVFEAKYLAYSGNGE